MTFRDRYERYRTKFETELASFCDGFAYEPAILTESMRYSLLSGGKRVRPVLFFSSLELYGSSFEEEFPLAIALECIHTYSLIHDDLPAMDNDDFRRGRPSNHKVFGEANAILAGDALLSLAFELLLRESGRDKEHLAAALALSDAAGANGMIAGQSADLLYTGREGGERELGFIYDHKTGRLIQAAAVMGAVVSGKPSAQAEAFGLALGTLFQLTDDILDEKGESAKMGKTLGKDREEDKLTCVKLYGMERAERLADECVARCNAALDGIDGDRDFLREFVRYVRGRSN